VTGRRIALLTPALGTGNVGDHFIELAVGRLLDANVEYTRISTRVAPSHEDIEAVNACECALLCGTNLYQHDWHSELTPEHLAALEVPVIPFGVGSSAAALSDLDVGSETAAMVRALHAHCVAGSVRDPFTVAVIERLGVENSVLTGCPVLFWSGAAELPAPARVGRRRLVITARNWLMHRWPDAVDHPVQIEYLRQVIAAFADDDYVFAVHEDFDESLVDALAIPAERVVGGDAPEDFVALYTDPANVVLAMRLHAGMLALANGVPAVFVGHDTRTYSFCQMLGLDWIELFGRDAAERTIARLRAELSGEPAPLDDARRAYRTLRERMTTFLALNELPAGPAFAEPLGALR
jgi:hypothetical protein